MCYKKLIPVLKLLALTTLIIAVGCVKQDKPKSYADLKLELNNELQIATSYHDSLKLVCRFAFKTARGGARNLNDFGLPRFSNLNWESMVFKIESDSFGFYCTHYVDWVIVMQNEYKNLAYKGFNVSLSSMKDNHTGGHAIRLQVDTLQINGKDSIVHYIFNDQFAEWWEDHNGNLLTYHNFCRLVYEGKQDSITRGGGGGYPRNCWIKV